MGTPTGYTLIHLVPGGAFLLVVVYFAFLLPPVRRLSKKEAQQRLREAYLLLMGACFLGFLCELLAVFMP